MLIQFAFHFLMQFLHILIFYTWIFNMIKLNLSYLTQTHARTHLYIEKLAKNMYLDKYIPIYREYLYSLYNYKQQGSHLHNFLWISIHSENKEKKKKEKKKNG